MQYRRVVLPALALISGQNAAAQRAEGRTVGLRTGAMLALGAVLLGAATAWTREPAASVAPASSGQPVVTDTIAPVRDPAPAWRSAGGCGAP